MAHPLLSLLARERQQGFPNLRGTRLRGVLPVPGEWLNQALREGRPESDDSPLKGIALAVQDSTRATLLVSLEQWPLPKLMEIPLLWDPILDMNAPGGPVLRLTHELGGLLGTAIPIIVGAAKQPGIRAEGRHVTVALGELLKKQGFGDALSFFTKLELRGAPGALFLHFTLEIPQ